MGSCWTDSPGVARLGHDVPRHVTQWARHAERAGLGRVWIIAGRYRPGAFTLAGATPASARRAGCRQGSSHSRSTEAWRRSASGGRTDQQVGVTTFSGMLFVASTVSEMQEAIELFGREVIPNFP